MIANEELAIVVGGLPGLGLDASHDLQAGVARGAFFELPSVRAEAALVER